MSDRYPMVNHGGPWGDNVVRWEQEVLAYFPEASFSLSKGWFHGALRDDDEVMRASDLGKLINVLLAREKDGKGYL